MLLGGMMVGKVDIVGLMNRYKSVASLVHSASIVARYLTDRLRYSRGTRLVMGNALVAGCSTACATRGFRSGSAPRSTISCGDGDRVAGAVLSTETGPIRVKARKGVVMATGGFAHNKRFREAFMPNPVPPYSMAAAENTGDGLRVGEMAGAKVEGDSHQSSAFWTPVSVTYRPDGTTGLFPHLSLDRAKPGVIAVNAAGRRFVNEGLSYHDFVEAMYRAHEVTPTIPAYLICDSTFIRKYGLGVIHPGTRNLAPFERSGYATCADTLGELADKLGIDRDGFEDTVRRHNEFAKQGSDLDFGKGDLELNRFNGDPENRPNPCLAPIVKPPFVSVAVWPAEIGCSVGLATNPDCQVLDAEDKPIPGSTPAATTWRRLWRDPTRVPGPRLARRWCSAIARRSMPRGRGCVLDVTFGVEIRTHG